MAMTEDLDVFFDDDEFAEAATLNGSTAGNVIFDGDYLRALGMVPSSNPTALAQAADYSASALEGTLVVTGTSPAAGTYVIRDRQPQDDGALVLLQLERQ